MATNRSMTFSRHLFALTLTCNEYEVDHQYLTIDANYDVFPNTDLVTACLEYQTLTKSYYNRELIFC